MDSFVLMLIASTAVCIKGNEQQIEVYEIRKSKDDLEDLRNDDDVKIKIDTEYYDPDGLNRLYYSTANREHDFQDRSADIITNNIIDKLRKIVISKGLNGKDEKADDDIASYRDLKDEHIFDDNDKTPLVVVADKSILYHLIPKRQSHRNKLESVLRSINYDTEVEDRTAPPRVRIYYDYDYD